MGREPHDGLAVAYCPHPLAEAVSSVLERFTTVFGMGTGGTTPLGPPDQVAGEGFEPPTSGL